MTRRNAELWMLWLLPLLLLRQLLPTGVMPSAGPEGARLVLCSVPGLTAPASAQTGLDRAVPRPDSSHTLCPFAAAATPGPVFVLHLPVLQTAQRPLAIAVANAQRTAQSGPPRMQLTRAPPLLS